MKLIAHVDKPHQHAFGHRCSHGLNLGQGVIDLWKFERLFEAVQFKPQPVLAVVRMNGNTHQRMRDVSDFAHGDEDSGDIACSTFGAFLQAHVF